jgi:pimeloyl-ACP methyl ester carboxylesterase
MANGLDRDGLSRDPQVVAAYSADPLVHDRISARLGMDLLQTGQWALEHAAGFPLPLLLMHGSADRITSAAASQEFASRVSSDCTLKLWEGLYHETHPEPHFEFRIADCETSFRISNCGLRNFISDFELRIANLETASLGPEIPNPKSEFPNPNSQIREVLP